jgi:hypothetical protein
MPKRLHFLAYALRVSGVIRTRLLGLGALLALCALLGAVGPGPAAADQNCGKAHATNPRGRTVIFRSVARRLGCFKAGSVVRRFWRKSPAPFERHYVGAFSCLYVERFDPGALAFRCRSGRRIAFGYWTRRRPF